MPRLTNVFPYCPHGPPYGIKLVKCPAWVAATLSGSFNKGVIYRQHAGFAAFSDSHVSVWAEPCTRQRDRVNSLGSTGPKYTLWLSSFVPLQSSTLLLKLQDGSCITHTAASRCLGKVLWTRMLFSVVVLLCVFACWYSSQVESVITS